MAITAAQLITYLGIPTPAAGSSDELAVTQAVAAINTLVPDTVPRVAPTDTIPDPVWPPDVVNAALLMAARTFTRRRSPTGMATYDETGAAIAIPRWDPDVERMLRIGKWAPPVVG